MADSNIRVPVRDLGTEPTEPQQTHPNVERSAPLETGRRVLIRNGAESQTVEVRGPDGSLEVQIVITPQGPVVRLTAGRMEIATTEDVDITCRKFKVHASKGVEIESEGKMALRSEDDLDLEAKQGDFRAKGETIWLN
jgi:hypothetical protein